MLFLLIDAVALYYSNGVARILLNFKFESRISNRRQSKSDTERTQTGDCETCFVMLNITATPRFTSITNYTFSTAVDGGERVDSSRAIMQITDTQHMVWTYRSTVCALGELDKMGEMNGMELIKRQKNREKMKLKGKRIALGEQCKTATVKQIETNRITQQEATCVRVFVFFGKPFVSGSY